ncbi:MAG: hypothetical protein ACI9OJ_001718 [Myxococcota bacterium]|jgi:hypothetical protein
MRFSEGNMLKQSKNERFIRVLMPVICLLGIGCAAPIAQLDDDAVEGSGEVAMLRQQVKQWKGKRIRGVDPSAMTRMKGWLTRMDDPDTAPAAVAVYAAAVKSQLEVLITAEQRYGAVVPGTGANQ